MNNNILFLSFTFCDRLLPFLILITERLRHTDRRIDKETRPSIWYRYFRKIPLLRQVHLNSMAQI